MMMCTIKYFKLYKNCSNLPFVVRSSNIRHNSHATPINVYNTLTRVKQPLVLHRPNVLYWYICGPTVYDSAHVGHASCYMNFDIIKKILKNYFLINVVDVMNITDIDDKIIIKAKQENKSFTEVARFYESEFLADLSSLNVDKPSVLLRVTDHIPQIVDFIKKLVDTKHAYTTPSGCVYFDTKAYGRHFFIDNAESITTIEPESNDKRCPNDFALWKAKKYDYEPAWSSPWSNGRPGWHIECSTLANVAFGKHMDFHSGGKDLMFPHHENELIQCCAYHDMATWSTSWLHFGLLNLKQVKMSKSLKNTLSIRDLLKAYHMNEFRIFCLLSHYRKDKEYSDEQMHKPVAILKALKSFVQLISAYCNGQLNQTLVIDDNQVFDMLEATKSNVHKALCDDFSTSIAFNQLLDLVAFVNRQFKKSSVDESNCHVSLCKNYGSLMATLQYVQFVLRCFGITLTETDEQNKKVKSFDAFYAVAPSIISGKKVS